MKQLILLLCFILSFSLGLFGQDSAKTNPIICADGGLDIPVGDMSGLQLNAGLNYQAGKNLFILRVNAIGGNFPEAVISATMPHSVSNLFDYGVLYGRRFINGMHCQYKFSCKRTLIVRLRYIALKTLNANDLIIKA